MILTVEEVTRIARRQRERLQHYGNGGCPELSNFQGHCMVAASMDGSIATMLLDLDSLLETTTKLLADQP